MLQECSIRCDLTLEHLASANFSINKATIEPFLKLIGFNFGRHKLVALKTEIDCFFKEEFNTNSNVLYQACFYEFYQWLTSPEAKTLDNTQVRSLFDQWYNQYIQLERLNGLTQANVRKIASPAHYFARNEEESIIKDFIIDKNAQILVVVGEPGIGKSSIVNQVVNSLNWSDGRHLFLDIREFSQYLKDVKHPFDLRYLDKLEFICLDNAEFSVEHQKLTTEYRELFDMILARDKKLLLLCRSEPWERIGKDFTKNYPKCQILPIPGLEEKAILAHYPTLQSLVDKSTHSYHQHRGNSSFHEQISQLLRTPFYLNIMVQHPEIIAQLSEQSLETFRHTIINIAITQPAFVKSQGKNLPGKERKALLRELVFAKNRANTESGLLAVRNRQTSIDSLVKDGILIELSDNGYNFSHLLYEEFMVGEIIQKRCKLWLETQDEPKQLLRWLQRNLPSYEKYLWAKYLNDSVELSELLSSWHQGKGNNNFENCGRLLYTAITTYDDELLDLMIPLINDLNRQFIYAESQTTFLSIAITSQNIHAVSILFKERIDVYLFPEQEYDENASNDDENNWRVYEDLDLANYDDGGLCVADYYKRRPYKYIFREGRDDPYDECYDSLEDEPRLEEYHGENQWVLSPFMEALQTNNKKLFNSMLDHALLGKNINKESLLHLAVLLQEPILVKKIIKAGCKIDGRDCDRETPLHNAIYCSYDSNQDSKAREKSYQIFKLLLDAYVRQNKSLDNKNVVGWTPLHLAVLMRDQKMIRDLIQQGAKPNTIDEQGYSAKELLNKIEQEEDIYLGSNLIVNSDLGSFSDLDSGSTSNLDDDFSFNASQSLFLNTSKQSQITDFFKPNNKKRKLAEFSEPARLVKRPKFIPGSSTDLGLFKRVSNSGQTQADESWYDDEQMQQLLDRYLGNLTNVQIIAPIDAYQLSGQTLEDNLRDNLQRSIEDNYCIDTVVVPLNLNNLHWVAVYIHYANEEKTHPTVGYFDPNGNRMPAFIENALFTVYSGLQTQEILQSPIRLQNDGFNCGPWVIAILVSLVKTGALPAEDFDIAKQRAEDVQILAMDSNTMLIK